MAIIERVGKRGKTYRVQLFKKGQRQPVYDQSFGSDLSAAKEADEKGKAKLALGLNPGERVYKFRDLLRQQSEATQSIKDGILAEWLAAGKPNPYPHQEPAVVVTKPSSPTFREVIERFRKEVAMKMDSDIYENRCRAFMKLDMAKKLVIELTRSDFKKWQEQRAKQRVKKTGKRVSPTTVNHELDLLKRILNTAWTDFGIAMPFNHIGQPHNPATIKALPAVPGRDLRLTADEMECLFRHLARDPLGEAKMTLPVKLCLEVNFRRGELFRMKRSDIDFERKCVLLRAETVKNRRERLVPLTSRAIAILREAIERIPEDVQGRVFPFNPDSWSRRFYDRRTDAAKEFPRIKGFTFHDTRHEAITNMANKIKSETKLARATGHSSTKHLMRYINPRVGELADMLE
jgi:integrase